MLSLLNVCRYNQVNALRTACRTGLPECQTLSSTWFQQWMKTPEDNPWVDFILFLSE